MKNKFRNTSIVLMVVYIFGFLFVLSQLFYQLPEEIISSLPKLNFNDLPAINKNLTIYLKAFGLLFFLGLFSILGLLFSLGSSNVLVVEKERIVSMDKKNKENSESNLAFGSLSNFESLLSNTRADYNEKIDMYFKMLCVDFDFSQGLLYKVIDQGKSAECVSSFAYCEVENREMKFEKGDGFVGQVLKDHKPLQVKDIPEKYVKVITGLGESYPTSLLFVPILQEGNVTFVLELASFHKLEDTVIAYIQNSGEKLLNAHVNTTSHVSI